MQIKYFQPSHSKWLWRFVVEKDLFWRRVISIKYGEDWGDGQQRWCEVLMG